VKPPAGFFDFAGATAVEDLSIPRAIPGISPPILPTRLLPKMKKQMLEDMKKWRAVKQEQSSAPTNAS
jgi:hypothetical protein